MKDVVVEVRLNTLPVMTSVMVIRYSLTTPLTSLNGGGAHDSEMDEELVGVRTIFWGELEGAKETCR